MNEIIKNLLYFLISSGLIVWLIKAIFSQYFSKDLEKFKSNLEKEAFSYRVRYEKMHAERAEVIKELYKKISKTHRSFSSFMAIFQKAGDTPEKEKGEIAAQNANDFTDYYEENKIFVDRKLSEKIDKLSAAFRDAWLKFEISRGSRKEEDTYIKFWESAWKTITEETPKIKEEIEDDFRKIIGIE